MRATWFVLRRLATQVLTTSSLPKKMLGLDGVRKEDLYEVEVQSYS